MKERDNPYLDYLDREWSTNEGEHPDMMIGKDAPAPGPIIHTFGFDVAAGRDPLHHPGDRRGLSPRRK